MDDFRIHEELNRQTTSTDDRQREANLRRCHSWTARKAEGQRVVDTVRRRITKEVDLEYGVCSYVAVVYSRYH
jgi:hypothetical protein